MSCWCNLEFRGITEEIAEARDEGNRLNSFPPSYQQTPPQQACVKNVDLLLSSALLSCYFKP